jgi:N-acetylmuramic acid 6-phosphate etherase
MKAGTAQKLALHSLSTAVMIRLGRTYSNLMVDMVATNAKLRARLGQILVEATGLDDERCSQKLAESDGDLKVALVALLGAVSVEDARAALTAGNGRVRDAIDLLRVPDPS